MEMLVRPSEKRRVFPIANLALLMIHAYMLEPLTGAVALAAGVIACLACWSSFCEQLLNAETLQELVYMFKATGSLDIALYHCYQTC